MSHRKKKVDHVIKRLVKTCVLVQIAPNDASKSLAPRFWHTAVPHVQHTWGFIPAVLSVPVHWKSGNSAQGCVWWYEQKSFYAHNVLPVPPGTPVTQSACSGCCSACVTAQPFCT